MIAICFDRIDVALFALLGACLGAIIVLLTMPGDVIRYWQDRGKMR